MQQTLEEILGARGTRRWIAQIVGNWGAEDVIVTKAPKHHLPPEVLATVPAAWEKAMRSVGEELGKEGIDWRIVPAEPYARMEVRRGENWALRMFAGDQTRIEWYGFLFSGRLALRHSPANYAESLATNNTDPWGLIRKYGERLALADGHAVSVSVTAVDSSGKEVMQLFRRGTGLGEYGRRIGTAAGNSLKPELTPFDIAHRESVEESRVMPFIGAYTAALNESGIMPAIPDAREYERAGLANSEFETIEELEGGRRVRFLDRRGKEAYATLVSPETRFRMTGLVLNVDPDDKTPHHKSEYTFIARTKLPIEALNDEKFGWTRNDEHANAIYVLFTEKALTEFAVENFRELMPPTHAVLLSSIRAVFGNDAFSRALEATNARYPITSEHPLVNAIDTGRYTLPELISR